MLMKGLKNFIQFTDFDQIIDLVAGRGRGVKAGPLRKKLLFLKLEKIFRQKMGSLSSSGGP